MNKKYLIISHNYWPAIGGAEKLFQAIAENLTKKGESVEVLTSNAKNSEMYSLRFPVIIEPKSDIINHVLIYRENIKNPIQKVSNIILGQLNKRGLGYDFGSLFIGPHFFLYTLKYLFSGKKYTHIICGPYPTSVPFYGYLMKILKPPVKLILVPCIHVEDPIHTGRVLKFISRRADKIMVLTKEETNFFKSLGIKDDDIIEIGVGVDDTLLNAKKENRRDYVFDYVLYMGQEVPHKNIILLIDAMRKVWDKYDKVKLILAGAKTSYSKVIDDYINNLEENTREKIIRLNDFDDSKKIELLDNCKIMVLPSSKESFGIVFVEAWSRKKPVIGAKIPAVRYLIKDGRNGLLFENGDADDLAIKILFLLNNSERANEIGNSGYKTVVENYKWDVIINNIININ
jgi:glycosyltransferase involved in cell wall biosynthesis